MKVSVLSWIVKKLRSCLAIVQDTDTATRNIAAGKYVIWKGSMKKALSAITQGDTLSSTNLGDVTDGVANEINSKTTWKYHDSKTGSVQISLPAEYNELLVCTKVIITTNIYMCFQLILPKEAMPTGADTYVIGRSEGYSSIIGSVGFNVTATTIQLMHAVLNNGADNILATTETTVYYR